MRLRDLQCSREWLWLSNAQRNRMLNLCEGNAEARIAQAFDLYLVPTHAHGGSEETPFWHLTLMVPTISFAEHPTLQLWSVNRSRHLHWTLLSTLIGDPVSSPVHFQLNTPRVFQRNLWLMVATLHSARDRVLQRDATARLGG